MTPDRRAESGNESSAALDGASAPRSRLPIGGTRVLLCRLRSPIARESCVGLFGLQTEIDFALTDRLEIVLVGNAALRKPGRLPGGERQGPALSREERRTHKRVVLVFSQQVPRDDEDLARCRHCRHLGAAPGSQSLVESSQRPRALDRGPGRFYEGGPSTCASALRDAAMVGGMRAGLPHSRIQAEVANQLGRRPKPANVANDRNDCQRRDGIDARNGDEPLDRGRIQSKPGQRLSKMSKLGSQPFDLAKRRDHDFSLMDRQLREGLLKKPLLPRLAKQIRTGTPGDQIANEDPMDAILEADVVADQPDAVGYALAERLGLRIRHPDFGQPAAGEQADKDLCVDLVRLDLGVSDGPSLQRVGNDNVVNVLLEQLHDRVGIAGCFEDEMIIAAERGREPSERFRSRRNLSQVREPSILELCHLRRLAVHVQAEVSRRHPPSRMIGRQAGNTTPTDSRSQRTWVGRRGGQLKARVRNPTPDDGLPVLRAPGAPHPDGRTIPPRQTVTSAESEGYRTISYLIREGFRRQNGMCVESRVMSLRKEQPAMPQATTEPSARTPLAPVSCGYADVNGIQLYHEIYGQGEPLVLLHGGLMTIGEMSTPLESLAKTHQVTAVELQGHGRTSRSASRHSSTRWAR